MKIFLIKKSHRELVSLASGQFEVEQMIEIVTCCIRHPWPQPVR